MARLVGIVSCLGVLFGLAAAPLAAAGPHDDAVESGIAEALVERGFENVVAAAREGNIAVWYENRVYRYEMTAMGVVAFLAASRTEPTAMVEILPENRGVPIAAVSARAEDWIAFLTGKEGSAWFRGRVVVGSPGANRPPPLPSRRTRNNPSWWRTDLALRPIFSFELGIPDDPYQASYYVAPEANLVPAPGALVTLQGMVRLRDELSPSSRSLAPGRNTITWGGWAPGAWLTTMSAGYFPGNRYGVAAVAGRLFAGGALELRVGGDLSGFLQFAHRVTLYSGLESWSAFVAGTYRTPRIDLETTVTGARFLEGVLGVRLDVTRRFRESKVGFFGIKTEDDDVVGVAVRVPLPVRRWKRPSAVRAVTVPDFPITYRESVENIGLQVALFETLERFRKGLYPTFVRNNLEDMRQAVPISVGGRGR